MTSYRHQDQTHGGHRTPWRVAPRIALGLLGLVLAGCSSFSLSRYVSPDVTGRVVDADTRRPIQGVKVYRMSPEKSRRPMEPLKGSQALKQPPATLTDKDGHFSLPGERSVIAFGQAYWFSVNLAFEHPAYERILASYTSERATNSPNGAPLIQTGDVLMPSRPR